MPPPFPLKALKSPGATNIHFSPFEDSTSKHCGELRDLARRCGELAKSSRQLEALMSTSQARLAPSSRLCLGRSVALSPFLSFLFFLFFFWGGGRPSLPWSVAFFFYVFFLLSFFFLGGGEALCAM